MNAFIAWTPLHVINIINTTINYFPGVKSDLFIYDEFNGAEDVYKEIKALDVFDNVYLIAHKKTGNFVSKGLSILFNRQKYVEHNETYSDIFIQGGNYFSKVLYGEIKKKNIDVKLHYIEDGLGAYIDSPIIRIDTPLKKAVKFSNRYSMYHAVIESYYVYEPRLIKNKRDMLYNQLPKLTKKNNALEIINKVFLISESKTVKLSDRILFFDQPFLADGFSIDEVSFVEELKELTVNIPTVVKFHPRSNEDKYGEVETLSTNLPWEMLCLNLKMNNVFLLSIASTAAFTPYMMYGIEMPVIVLAPYYLEKMDRNIKNERTLKMLDNVAEFSSFFKENTETNIFMPETLEELEKLLS